MTRPLCLASLLLIAAFASQAKAAPVVWPDNGHAYEIVGTLGQQTIFWATAKTDAEQMQYQGVSGHLATITSAEENAFIQATFNDGQRHSAWIGLTDDEAYGGQESGSTANPGAPFWVWVTGEPVSYTNWLPGSPNNQGGTEDYTEFVFEMGGQWNDLSDFAPHLRDFYIVEYPVPEPSSIVLAGVGLLALFVFRGRTGSRPGGVMPQKARGMRSAS